MFPKRWGYLGVSFDEPKIFPRAPLAFDIISNMKKALIILSVVLLAAEATAYVGGHQRGYKNGDTSKGISKGWAFSVTLTDHAMHDYVPKAPESDGEPPEGVDAL